MRNARVQESASSINTFVPPPPTKSSRASRPNQSGPRRADTFEPPAEGDDPCTSGPDPDDIRAGPSSRGTNAGTHAVPPTSRQTRLDLNWRSQIPTLQREIVQHASLQQQRRVQRRDASLSAMQVELGEAWKLHACCHRSGNTYDFSSMIPGGSINVTYRHLTCCGTLSVPSWACTTCNEVFRPRAVQLGCFPATPIEQYVWFDQDMLLAYSSLGLPHGVSGTG